mmetsp:Transcript_18736/g.34016  ORF Transcript_18736/g.34016 Transcript_18736/m.34016 type:complete len:396 (-) Transcript_18736:603-1790(-)
MDLETLKSRLSKLGVDLCPGAPVENDTELPTKVSNIRPDFHSLDSGRGQTKDVRTMLERITRVESALSSAENQASAASQAAQEDLLLRRAESARAKAKSASNKLEMNGLESSNNKSRKPRPISARGAVSIPPAVSSTALTRASSPPANLNPLTSKGLSCAIRSDSHMKRIPAHTPLAQVLAQFKEAEAAWANEKARLRREAVAERKRANTVELEHRRLERVADHRTLDLKALKTALKNRDAQLEAAGERVAELEMLLERTQSEATAQITSLAAERDSLRQLLLAALQRLEAVDHVVQRADISTSLMEEKVKALETERQRALEAATRARTEVQELAESRRKLQWQSKLLEKMSEVQLKHNQRKSEAIRKLLNTEPGHASDAMGEVESIDVTVSGDD